MRISLVGLALSGVLVAAPTGATAQLAPGVAVSSRPGTTLVAATLVVPAGSAMDPDGIPGAARLVGEAIAQAVRWRLDPDGVQLAVRTERGWTAFTLLAAPEQWERAWDVLEDVAFRVSLADAPLAAARAALLEEFAFEEGAPVREFDRELYYTIGGARASWSRDPRGDADAIRAASIDALESFRESYYRMAQATVGLVGPVDPGAARAALDPVGSGPLDLPREAGPAWTRGDRLPLRRDVTNAWIGVAFAAQRDLPRTQLDFVAYQIQETLSPSPPDPGLYSLDVHVEDTPRGSVLVIEAAVMPEVSESWERRILTAVERLADPVEDAIFRWQRRRFRSAVLLREGQPEESALRMALDLARDGRARPLQDEVWAIGTGELARAIERLGSPRVLVLGPDLTGR